MNLEVIQAMIPKPGGNPGCRVQHTRATRLYSGTASKIRFITPHCPLCGRKSDVGKLIERRHGWYCWRCNLEFDTNTGEMYKITQDGEVRLVLVNSETFETVECKTVRVKITSAGKPYKLENVAKLGVYGGFMVFEFADGRQKLYNAAMVESVEEV